MRHEIVVKAISENQTFEFPVVVDLNASDLELSIQRFAAHAAIRDMELSSNRAGLKKEIVDLAIKYHLASKYTSFVAIHVNEQHSASGQMMHMDVDESIHQSKAGFLDMAGEKLEEIGRGVDDFTHKWQLLLWKVSIAWWTPSWCCCCRRWWWWRCLPDGIRGI